jgi:predicted transcriptional regulator
MKKTFFMFLLSLSLMVSYAIAAELKVGDKAPDFKLQDSSNKEYTRNGPEFAGKVLYVNYQHADSADLNNHVTDALKADKDIEQLVKEKKYELLGIANLKGSWEPDAIIKVIIKRKQKQTGAIILLDTDYTFLNLWGLKNKDANSILLDKDRIVRYIFKGKVPEGDIPKIKQLIKEYSAK